MTQCIRTASISRGAMVAALVSALLSIAAFMAVAPGIASAGTNNYVCEPGEFCLGRLYNLSGGLYPDLRDNVFFYYTDPAQNETLGRVSQNSWSAYNHGNYQDVMVYTWFSYTGNKACIKKDRYIGDLGSWKDRISSLRWVTRAECNAAAQL
jgi:hypothetical protein